MDIERVFDGDVTRDDYERWLAQFPPSDRPFAQKLVQAFRYYSLRRMNAVLRQLYLQVVERAGVPEDRLRFIPVGYVAKSGSVIAYYFRKQNKLKEDRFLSSNHVGILESNAGLVPVLIDDFIGSGHQSLQVVTELRAAAPTFEGKVVFAAVVGLQPGLELLRRDAGIVPIAADIVQTSELPFADPSPIFPDSSERQAALEAITKYGRRLYAQHPLGYARSQGLIGFFYSTPNNTLPIFWSSEDGWTPLLPHGESFRDPSYLFGPPSGLSEQLAQRGPRRPLTEGAELDKYDIPEDMAVKIFGEFHQTPIFLVLAPILRDLVVTSTGFSSLLAAVSKLRHLEHEQHPVCCAVLITRNADVLSAHGSPVVKAAGVVTLDLANELSSMAQLVDGLSGAVVAGPEGRIAGVVLYEAKPNGVDTFLPSRYRAVALASKASDALCFLFLGNGRIQVFHKGQRILSYRNAGWHHQLPDFRRGIAVLAREHVVPVNVLEAVMRIALLLADSGKGALLTVGDHEGVVRLSDPPKTAHLQLQPLQLGAVPDEMVTGLMAQDGATVISADAMIVQTMTFLRPPAGTEAEEEVGRGSKHSTAAKISRATHCIAIAVSADGRVTLYGKGAVCLKIMG